MIPSLFASKWNSTFQLIQSYQVNWETHRKCHRMSTIPPAGPQIWNRNTDSIQCASAKCPTFRDWMSAALKLWSWWEHRTTMKTAKTVWRHENNNKVSSSAGLKTLDAHRKLRTREIVSPDLNGQSGATKSERHRKNKQQPLYQSFIRSYKTTQPPSGRDYFPIKSR